jgi:CheY-like chemotaxis protein
VRVLVVDDHPAFRRALTSALRLVDDIEVAGEAGGGVAACEEAEQLQPDVIVMDLSMPDLSGIDAMKRIHETRPDVPVVILTAHADEGVEREARCCHRRVERHDAQRHAAPRRGRSGPPARPAVARRVSAIAGVSRPARGPRRPQAWWPGT